MGIQHRYVIIHVDGRLSSFVTDGFCPLGKMQEIVGGSIEHTRIRIDMKPYDVFVNEEGRLIPLEPNKRFNELMGNILVGHVDVEGNFAGLADDELIEVPTSIDKERT